MDTPGLENLLVTGKWIHRSTNMNHCLFYYYQGKCLNLNWQIKHKHLLLNVKQMQYFG